MRQDTRVLLDRLGEDKFSYYDFESPSFEIDIWPIFEALLLDERVIGKPNHVVALELSLADPLPAESREAATLPGKAPVPQPLVVPGRDVAGLSMFAKYSAAIATQGHGASVRDTLGRLALDRA